MKSVNNGKERRLLKKSASMSSCVNRSSSFIREETKNGRTFNKDKDNLEHLRFTNAMKTISAGQRGRPRATPASATPASKSKLIKHNGNGLLSPVSLRKAQFALRSRHQSLEPSYEEQNQRITNFDPVQEMTHHIRCITAIRMSSDSVNPFIVTAGLDCMVFVSDFHSGDVLKKIDTANSFVFSLDISADNSVFATAAQDGCVRIYGRNQDWQCQRVISQQSPGVCRIIWAVQLYTSQLGRPGDRGEDRYCVSGGATKVIHVFDWVTGVERMALKGHQEGVRCLAVAEDGTLASGSNDFTVRLWNLKQQGKFLFTLRGHSAEVNALCFMPGSSSLVTACENNIFRVWNYTDGARLMIFDGYRGLSILCLAAVPNAHGAPWVLVGGSHTKGYPTLNVEIWNTKTGEKVGNCLGCRYQICGLDVRRVLHEERGEKERGESFVVVAGGLDCKTRCWNIDKILLDRHHLSPDHDVNLDLDIDLDVDMNVMVGVESCITTDSVLSSGYATIHHK